MQIFLDPMRKPEVHFDKVIRTFKDFMKVIDKYDINFISLNYELDNKSNALDVIWYLKENNIKIPFINIHTTNNIAKSQIRTYLKKYLPETIITFIVNV